MIPFFTLLYIIFKHVYINNILKMLTVGGMYLQGYPEIHVSHRERRGHGLCVVRA